MVKSVYLVELLDTVTHKIISRGKFEGRSPLEVQRKFAKTLPKKIDLGEMRDEKYGRYSILCTKNKLTVESVDIK